MQVGKPSQTALSAAFHRAAHQVLEQGRIFADPLALRILGVEAATVAQKAAEDSSGRLMRLFVSVRSRFAEDSLRAAFENGTRQLVVLGAGLDTYAYRCPFGSRLRIFEVDHPATQAWKRQCLRDAAIPLPGSLTFAPLDFERETLADGLAAAGFDRAVPTFFSWLGVVPYLKQEAVSSTLAFVAGLPGGAHVVFDYSDPRSSLSPEMRDFHDRRARRVAQLGAKFTPERLDRRAIVYIRQSTPGQVLYNKESQLRQYGLVDRAKELGFRDVQVIDDDLGRSAGGQVERPGFQRLVAEVCSGNVGAILCIEASRLARNGRDWHHLIEMCGLIAAVVIDPDGVYDPSLINDRLLLGLNRPDTQSTSYSTSC